MLEATGKRGKQREYPNMADALGGKGGLVCLPEKRSELEDLLLDH